MVSSDPIVPTLLSAALYVAVAAVFVRFWLLGGESRWIDPSAGDLLSQYYPLFRYGFAELSAGRLPLWNPHQLAGVPFLAYPVASFVYPLYLPFLVLPTEMAMNVDLVLHLALAAFSTFLLCRSFGIGAPGSALAGLVYAFHGGMMIKVYYPGYLASVAWVPLFFLFTQRLIDRPSGRAAIALAAVFGVSLLGGHGVQFTYMAGLALLPFVLVRIALRARAAGVRAAAASLVFLGLSFALGALLASVRLIPAAEVARLSWRPPGALSWEDAVTMSVLPSIFYDNLLSPTPVLGPHMRPRYGAIMREGYVGIAPLALALAGALLWRRRLLALPIAAAGIAAVLYAFGANSFLFGIMYRLPGGAWFRGPDRALFIFGLAVAVLAAAGVDETMRRRRGLAIAAAAAAAVLAAAWVRGTSGRALMLVASQAAIVPFAIWLARSVLPRFSPAAPAAAIAAAALGIAATLDLWAGFPLSASYPSALQPYFARHAAVFREVREKQDLARTYVWSSFRQTEPLYFFSDVAKAGIFHRVYLPTDYEGLVQERIDRYLRFEAPGKIEPRTWAPIGYYPVRLSAANLPLFDLLGVRFYLLQEGMRKRYVDPSLDIDRRWRLLRKEPSGVMLYENPGAMPRAFVAPRFEVAAAGEMLDRLSTANLREVAFVEEPIELMAAASQPDLPLEARIVDYGANRVVLDASSPAGGLLVLTDQHFPGWTAALDGEPVPIHRADYLFRGIALPPGRHRVEMWYRPASVMIGAALTAAALAIMGVIFVRARARPELSS